MCVQCMAGAATIVAGTSGIRLWLTARVWTWLTPARKRHTTRGLLAVAVLASGLLVNGVTTQPTTPATGTPSLTNGAGHPPLVEPPSIDR